MSTLTKEQIRKLTPEQQEAVASLTLDGAKRRTLFLERAKRYRGQTWIPALIPALLMLVFFFGRAKTAAWSEGLVSFVMILIVYGVAQFQINGINRRLDALIKLLEPGLRSQEASAGHEETEPITGANHGQR